MHVPGALCVVCTRCALCVSSVSDISCVCEWHMFIPCGSEGAPCLVWLSQFCPLTTLPSHLQGFVWEIAPKYGAMVVFAEHRYYGKSLPFGNESYKDAAHLSYLTSEQALADFATLSTALKVSPCPPAWPPATLCPALQSSLYMSPSSPLIAFGGSYGGKCSVVIRADTLPLPLPLHCQGCWRHGSG